MNTFTLARSHGALDIQLPEQISQEIYFLSQDLVKVLINGAAAVGVALDRTMIQMFLTYLSELKEWNRKVNLTSLHDDQAIINAHFIDSLALIPHLPARGSILDLGSGAGFPGLPIKIARPALKVSLLESRRKKINFLKHIISTLRLDNIDAIHGRVEHLVSDQNTIPHVDVITARAFATLDRLLLVAHPLLKSGGCLIAMKGKEGLKELQGARTALNDLSLEVIRTVQFELPETHKKRCLFIIAGKKCFT